MKNTLKKFLVLLLALLLVALSSFGAFAETIYIYNGIKFYIVNNSSVAVCGSQSDVSRISVPNVINNRNVTEIANNAFIENEDITYLYLMNAKSLYRIGMFAFKGCINLNSKVEIPKTVTNIGVAAFEDCSSLNEVSVYSDISELPAQCFNNCSELSTVTLGDSITSIGSYAFANCTKLKYLELSDNIASIDKTAFLNDADLTIGCNYHSYAHNFAVENNIPYKIIGGVMIGDVNGDDGITIMDATIIQKKLLGMDTLDVVEYYDLAADVNRDGIVNIRDVTLIQMYVAGIITEF